MSFVLTFHPRLRCLGFKFPLGDAGAMDFVGGIAKWSF